MSICVQCLSQEIQCINETLDNTNLVGNDDYPKIIEDGLHMINNLKSAGVSNWKKGSDNLVFEQNHDVAFPQPGSRQGPHDKFKDNCYHYNELRNHTKDCP